jgi:hypothetical protein
MFMWHIWMTYFSLSIGISTCETVWWERRIQKQKLSKEIDQTMENRMYLIDEERRILEGKESQAPLG